MCIRDRAYSNRSYGAPATVAPEAGQLLSRTAVRMAERLFPERARFSGADWAPSAALPVLDRPVPERPPGDEYEAPRTAPAPG